MRSLWAQCSNETSLARKLVLYLCALVNLNMLYLMVDLLWNTISVSPKIATNAWSPLVLKVYPVLSCVIGWNVYLRASRRWVYARGRAAVEYRGVMTRGYSSLFESFDLFYFDFFCVTYSFCIISHAFVELGCLLVICIALRVFLLFWKVLSHHFVHWNFGGVLKLGW